VPRPGLHRTGRGYNGEPGPDRDRLLLSAAHYAVAVYAALVETGRMAPEALETFNSDGSSLEMIGAEHSPGMEITSGSFGQALSQAAGIAMGRRLKGDTGRTWVFMSDGEFQEGQTYEAIQTMSHYRMDSVGVFVDVNGQQVDGRTEDVMNIEPLQSRLTAFGAHVEVADGHDVDALVRSAGVDHTDKPLFVLCYTDPARGIPALEARRPHLHFVRIKGDEERDMLKADLAALQGGSNG
jgi:transketolase